MKRVISLFCVALLCLVSCITVFAQSPDFDRECSLTLEYAIEGACFENLNISIYQVASLSEDCTFDPIPPFDAYEVSLNDITDQKEWSKLATTLSGYILADSISPTLSGTTSNMGKVEFSHLGQGLYLVDKVVGTNEKGTYVFEPFVLCLPSPDGENFEYDVLAKPKAFEFEPTPTGTQYQVLKLWDDEGHKENRPQSVKVDIIKDGTVVETVTLSAENNWSYSWTDNGQSEWNVVERDVKNGYKVLVDKKTTSFVITNKYESDSSSDTPSDDTVKTGDTRVIWPYVLILCLSGFVLIILGLLPLRGYSYEKKNR